MAKSTTKKKIIKASDSKIRNAIEAGEILKNSGMEFLVATTLEDAANKVTIALSK
jgi:hypothetical protein